MNPKFRKSGSIWFGTAAHDEAARRQTANYSCTIVNLEKAKHTKNVEMKNLECLQRRRLLFLKFYYWKLLIFSPRKQITGRKIWRNIFLQRKSPFEVWISITSFPCGYSNSRSSNQKAEAPTTKPSLLAFAKVEIYQNFMNTKWENVNEYKHNISTKRLWTICYRWDHRAVWLSF
jgi:hypothetical protein